MARPYSLDLRERVLRLLRPERAVARLLRPTE
jgi:hypothetical protein